MMSSDTTELPSADARLPHSAQDRRAIHRRPITINSWPRSKARSPKRKSRSTTRRTRTRCSSRPTRGLIDEQAEAEDAEQHGRSGSGRRRDREQMQLRQPTHVPRAEANRDDRRPIRNDRRAGDEPNRSRTAGKRTVTAERTTVARASRARRRRSIVARGTSPSRVFRLAAFQQRRRRRVPRRRGADRRNGRRRLNRRAQPAKLSSLRNVGTYATLARSPTTDAPGDRRQPSSPDDAADRRPPRPPAEEKPKEFQPLDEVSDLIRRELATARVAEQLTKLMDQLASEAQRRVRQVLWPGARRPGRQKQAARRRHAALADLAPLAEKHGLKHGKTGPMSLLELRDTPVGKSGDSETGARLWQICLRKSTIWNFTSRSQRMDVDGNRYSR